jgi:hypothetical protein
MLKFAKKIEKFFVSIGYTSMLLISPSYTYKKGVKPFKFYLDDNVREIRSYPKKKEYARRVLLFIGGLIISVLLIAVVVLFLLSWLS